MQIFKRTCLSRFFAVAYKKYLNRGKVVCRIDQCGYLQRLGADCSAGSDCILEQWSQLKTQLFGEYLHGTFTVYLPDSYLNWLKYNENPDYCRLAEKLSSRIEIYLEDFYEDSIDGMKRRILRYLHNLLDSILVSF